MTSQTQKMFNLSIQINVANKVFIDLKHVFQRLSTVTNVSKFQGMKKKKKFIINVYCYDRWLLKVSTIVICGFVP